MISDSTERSWKVIAETAKACREFNELQFKYRQLAATLIFTAFGAMGYLWTAAEGGSKPSMQDVSVTASQPSASTVAAAACTIVVAGGPASTAASPMAVASSGRCSPATGPSPNNPSRYRVDWLLLIFGGATCAAILMIWYVDCGVYHRLLQAIFWEAQKFEAAIVQDALKPRAASPYDATTRWFTHPLDDARAPSHDRANASGTTVAMATAKDQVKDSRWIQRAARPDTVPLLHTAMSDWLGKSGVAGRSISGFYILGATVSYAPLLAYALDRHHGGFCGAAILLIGVTLLISFRQVLPWIEREVVESETDELLSQGKPARSTQ